LTVRIRAQVAFWIHRLTPDTDVVLKDGSALRLREQRPDDADSIRAFLEGLSLESRPFRFLSAESTSTKRLTA
jgi:hypothetical protein